MRETKKYTYDEANAVHFTGKELGEKLSFDQLYDTTWSYAQRNFRGRNARIDSEGHDVLMSMRGIRHALTAAKTADDLYGIIALPQLLQRAVWQGESKDKRNRNNILNIERYAASIQVGQNKYIAWMVVREEKGGEKTLGSFRVFLHQELKGL